MLQSVLCGPIYYANSIVDARRVFNRDSIDIVIANLQLPDACGFEVVRLFLKLMPQGKVIITSGFSRDMIEIPPEFSGCVFLQKPFSPRALRSVLREFGCAIM
jgi:DNA-binding response OmpR family regulator